MPNITWPLWRRGQRRPVCVKHHWFKGVWTKIVWHCRTRTIGLSKNIFTKLNLSTASIEHSSYIPLCLFSFQNRISTSTILPASLVNVFQVSKISETIAAACKAVAKCFSWNQNVQLHLKYSLLHSTDYSRLIAKINIIIFV